MSVLETPEFVAASEMMAIFLGTMHLTSEVYANSRWLVSKLHCSIAKDKTEEISQEKSKQTDKEKGKGR